MFITPAYAQAATPGGGDMIASLLPLILIFVVFYFLLIRPQQKKAKQHRDMIANVRRGDRIVTGGGIVAKVVRLEGDKELAVEIAPDVRVRVLRSTVAEVLSKSEPAERGGGEANREAEKPAKKARGEADAESEKPARKSRSGRTKATVEKSG